MRGQDEGHGHDHDHQVVPSDPTLRVKALESLLVEKGLVDPAALDALGEPADGWFRARFRCVLALVDPFTGGGQPHLVEGTCEGTITRTPRGSGGFGYDPLFVVAGTDKTMAELGADQKNLLSHRARAFAALRPVLEQVLAERADQARRVG